MHYLHLETVDADFLGCCSAWMTCASKHGSCTAMRTVPLATVAALVTAVNPGRGGGKGLLPGVAYGRGSLLRLLLWMV